MGKVWRVVVRRKVLPAENISDSQINRKWNQFSLTSLGVCSSLGVGVYVLAGIIARNTAGPAVILSFLIAALVSLLAGLCYAEFGARVPRAGSAYIYTYVCIGEFIAFIIGWTLILEYIIGGASISRGISLYLDSLITNQMQISFKELFPINALFLSPYFDFFALGLPIVCAIIFIFGLKRSNWLYNIFMAANVVIVLVIVIAGSFGANIANWEIKPTDSVTIGKGEFFPFGVWGVLKGAATCFYGYIAFDSIAAVEDHAKSPHKFIPFAMIGSLVVTFLLYFGVSTVLTLLVPYYQLDPNIPIPLAFEEHGWIVLQWIVTIGGIVALLTCLYGTYFPLLQLIEAMSHDGLIFKNFGKINKSTSSPVIGIILTGILMGLLGALFDLTQLVNMMSIGTLMAYTTMAIAVLLLRYTDGRIQKDEFLPSELQSTSHCLIVNEDKVTLPELFTQAFNSNHLKTPTPVSSFLVKIELFIFCILSTALSLCIFYGIDDLIKAEIWIIVTIPVLAVFMLIILLSITKQPTSHMERSFEVPLVPFTPAVLIFLNVFLLVTLNINAWIRFGVWIVIGLPIYLICLNRYQRHSHDSTVALDRQSLNGKMRYAYANSVYIEEDLPPEPLPAPPETPVNFDRSFPGYSFQFTNNEQNGIINKSPSSNDIVFLQKVATIEDINFEQVSINDEFNMPVEIQPEEIINDIENIQNPTRQRKDSIESVKNAIAYLDNVLSLENGESEEYVGVTSFMETPEDDRKTSLVSSVSTISINPPIEHFALVHQEDEIQSESLATLSDINENNLEKFEVPVTDLDELSENQDILGEEINPQNLDFHPKTPNVSRAESFLKGNARNDSVPSYDVDFANKLNMLLQDQLMEKPRKKGLYKPEFVYDSDNETEDKKSDKINLFAEINKELIAKQRLSELRRASKLSEDIQESPGDIRARLEKIFQQGPQNPVEARKTLRGYTGFDDAKPVTRDSKAKTLPASQPIANNDNNENVVLTKDTKERTPITNVFNGENKQESTDNKVNETEETKDEKLNSTNETVEEDVPNPEEIRNRLNKILAQRSQSSIQNPGLYFSLKVKDDNKSDIKNRFSVQPSISVMEGVDGNNMANQQKLLMKNVLKSITLTRKDSTKSTNENGIDSKN